MGCAATKKANPTNKTTNLHSKNERKTIFYCYQKGEVYLDDQGNSYHIVKNGLKLSKVPSLRKLDENPLYLKRVRKSSNHSHKTTYSEIPI